MEYGIWKTKCGLFVDPERRHSSLFTGGTYYMGKSYDVEHDAVLIPCPYKPYGTDENIQCEYREKLFDNNKFLAGWCAISRTNELYIYGQSVEKIEDDNDAEYHRNLEHLYQKNPNYRGCACIGRIGNNVKIEYNLDMCMIWRHGCEKPVCAVTGKERDLELVNIYIDVKYLADVGTLLEHEVIRKGIKLTDHPIVKECAERKLKEMETWDEKDWLWRTKQQKPFRIYIKNGPVKDLMQDLMDAQAGLEVIHDSDLKKVTAQKKKEQRLKKQEAKNKKLEKLNIEKWKSWLKSDDENLRRWGEKELHKRGIKINSIEYEQLTLI